MKVRIDSTTAVHCSGILKLEAFSHVIYKEMFFDSCSYTRRSKYRGRSGIQKLQVENWINIE